MIFPMSDTPYPSSSEKHAWIPIKLYNTIRREARGGGHHFGTLSWLVYGGAPYENYWMQLVPVFP